MREILAKAMARPQKFSENAPGKLREKLEKTGLRPVQSFPLYCPDTCEVQALTSDRLDEVNHLLRIQLPESLTAWCSRAGANCRGYGGR